MSVTDHPVKSRVYLDTPLAQHNRGDQIEPPSPVAHHLITVLRLKQGDPVQLFDGLGSEWYATLETVKKRQVILLLQKRLPTLPEPVVQTHLGIALFKPDRFDFALQKSVELGVTEITPLIAEHTSLKLSQTILEKKQKHWHGVVVAACEQCGRSHLPLLNPAAPFSTWVESASEEARFILTPHLTGKQKTPTSDKPSQPTLAVNAQLKAVSDAKSVSFATGPEGGFSKQETTIALQQQFKAITVGPRTLRAETAPVVFLSLLQAFLGDF